MSVTLKVANLEGTAHRIGNGITIKPSPSGRMMGPNNQV